jgi:acid-sensing ion channel, other
MKLIISTAKNRIKGFWRTVKDLFVDYANHSTIHGISYIAEQGRSWFERIWWILVVCISVFGCGKLILDAWNISPIIISFTDKPMPIWQIPFPAITICPFNFVHTDRINLTKMMVHQENGENMFQSLEENE